MLLSAKSGHLDVHQLNSTIAPECTFFGYQIPQTNGAIIWITQT